MTLPVHRWFRYSAGFSADWAADLIHDEKARRVLDPFAGSGTTLIAAESVGVASTGIDIHPFVARVARAKLAWREDCAHLAERGRKVLELAREDSDRVPPPHSPLIARCFPSESLADLVRIQRSIERSRRGDQIDELLWLGLVSILRACSPVGTAQWQYVLPNKSKSRVASPFEAFNTQTHLMVEDMRFMQGQATGPEALFLEEDARTAESVPDGWADLVVTSPPYANNFDYADATRLEMSFLGEIRGWGDLRPIREQLVRSCSQQMVRFDPDEPLSSPALKPIIDDLTMVYEELSAARKNMGGHKAYHSMVLAYFYDLAQTWQALRRCTAGGAKVCFVVGDSAPYGVHVPVERWLGELAVAAGFEKWTFDKVRDRNVKWANRKHRVPLHEGRLWVQG